MANGKSGSGDLSTKVEVFNVKLGNLERMLSESITDTKQWRTEYTTRADRLEQHTIDLAGKLEAKAQSAADDLARRLDTLEKNSVAQAAVDLYRKWLIGLAITTVLSLGALAVKLAPSFQIITR